MSKGVINMKHTITEFKEWPKDLEVCYHDWVIGTSKRVLTEKLGFGPTKYGTADQKFNYQWNCNLDDGKYYFTIYDMSYGEVIGDDDVVEYHIGFNCKYDDIHEFWPNTLEALNMLEVLDYIGLTPRHSETWMRFHENGIFEEIERLVKKNLATE